MKRRGLVDRPLYRDWILVLGGSVAILTAWHIAAASGSGTPTSGAPTPGAAAVLAGRMILGTAVPTVLLILVPASVRQAVRRWRRQPVKGASGGVRTRDRRR